MSQQQLLTDLRAARRAGGKLTPRLQVHLAQLSACWQADPTAGEIAFDAWCESLGSLNTRWTTIATSVRMAIADPDARYAPS